MSWRDDALAAREAGATWFCFLDATDDVGRSDTLTLTLRLTDPVTAEPTTLTTSLDRDHPRAPTLRDVWPAAGPAERAIAEAFGVEFAGGDPRPLLLHPDSGIPAHPARKDLLLPARQATPWPGARAEDGRARRRDTAAGVADPDATVEERISQAYGGGRGRR